MEKVQGAKCGELKKAEYQKPMGPAPFASFEDLSDEVRLCMDSLEEHDNKLQSISEVEPTSNSPKSSETLNLPNQYHPIGTTPVNVKLSNAPRIDISRASSSSHHDSRDSSPERELLDNIDAPNSKLGMGFKEDGAIDLKSSTEELDFHEPHEYRKTRDRTCSSPILDDTYVDHRKDSQCSDVVLLSISGRTSRLSSIGSQGSAKSRLSNASHLSIVSAQSAYSRCSSPHKTLLETSFCGSRNDCRGDSDNPTTKGESEEFEKMLLSSRNSNSSDVVLLDTFNLTSPKQTTAPEEIPPPRKVSVTKEKEPEKVKVKESKDVKEESQTKLPRKIISKSGVEYIYIPLKGPLPVDDSVEQPVAKPSTRHTSNTLKVSEKVSHAKQKNVKRDVTPKQVNVSIKTNEEPRNRQPEEPKYIRIKLKPDHCYDDDGEDQNKNKDKSSPICQNNQSFRPLDNIMKPNTLNLPFPNDGIARQPDDQLTCVVVRKQARSLTNTPSVSPKFGRRKVTTTKDTLSPSPSVSRRNSFACLFKSKDLVASPESPNMAKHKRKNTLSGILKTPTSRPKSRSKSKDREKAPSSTESIDSKGRHKSVLSIFRAKDKPVVENTAQGGSSKKTLAKKRGAAVNNIHIPSSKERDQEVPLNSDSIRIPLHSPTYYDEMAAKDKWNTACDTDRTKQTPREQQVPPTVVAMTEKKKDTPKKPPEVIPNNIPEPFVEVKTTIIIEDPPKCKVVEEQTKKVPPQPVVIEKQISVPSSESVTSTISTITTTVLSQMGNGTRNVQVEASDEVVIKMLAVRRNISGEDELNSSESERDSVEDYVKCPKNLSIHVETESLEIEREAIVLQQDSFEDELPYVPTTLPLERSAAVPIIPVKQRSVSNIKTFSIDRPRSTTPIQSSALENYCDDFVGKTKIESKVIDPNAEKIKITLPEKKKDSAGDGLTTEETPPPLPPKGVQKTWVNFEELPERRKPPKRIQTIPSRGHIDVPEFMVKDNVVYTYVNPEECKCECHELKELKDKERKSGSDAAVKEEVSCEEGTSENCKGKPSKELKQHR
ncbi:hypothetical protein GWI33_008771 [Rhynchophorus ferrugineus]|uniref:Uncharacterized protein n=1 Tax=Rhynchophorus ferrugineus TaxID=354439 RepID=A0A834MAU9_RHYFE|nr:hypothetical protein GWI33_008771 [Rhynchophorus ferrugineus]